MCILKILYLKAKIRATVPTKIRSGPKQILMLETDVSPYTIEPISIEVFALKNKPTTMPPKIIPSEKTY